MDEENMWNINDGYEKSQKKVIEISTARQGSTFQRPVDWAVWNSQRPQMQEEEKTPAPSSNNWDQATLAFFKTLDTTSQLDQISRLAQTEIGWPSKNIQSEG